MIFVIGGNGFVGSAYARLFNAQGLDYRILTRENIADYRGQSCDILINANGNSKKFMANREPLWEFDASTRSVAESVEWFNAGCYVYLSTGDVYPDQSSPEVTREDQSIDVARLSRYGLHKYLAEQIVRGTRENWLIFRMGGFVGPGLKKNAIFDMQNGDPVWLAPSSNLQFISTDTAARLVWSAIGSGHRNDIVNLGAQNTVNVGELHASLGSKSEFKPDGNHVQFELNLDKLVSLCGSTVPETRNEVGAFLGLGEGT